MGASLLARDPPLANDKSTICKTTTTTKKRENNVSSWNQQPVVKKKKEKEKKRRIKDQMLFFKKYIYIFIYGMLFLRVKCKYLIIS